MCIILLALAVPELKKEAPACASFFWHWLCLNSKKKHLPVHQSFGIGCA